MKWQEDSERLSNALKIPGVIGFGSNDDPDGVLSIFFERDNSILITAALAAEAARPFIIRYMFEKKP